MKLAVATVAALLAWAACSTAGLALPLQFELGKNFSLKAGESAQASDPALRVGFVGVVQDSRCPKGEQCVWAGDATLQVWVERGAGPRVVRELHATPGAAQTVRVLDYGLRLVRLDPQAVTGKVIAQGDYVATLMLSRDSATESDR